MEESSNSKIDEDYILWQRDIPVKYEADIAVIGGGIAGVSAACAAAKSGAHVILVERFGITGGVLTTGGVANFCGQMEKQGEVFDEIIADLKSWDAIGYGRESVFHYETLAVVLQELLLRRGVKLLLHTRCVDTVIHDGLISGVILSGMSGLEALRAKQFIDCSGESVVARTAGLATIEDWYDNRWRLPMSMMYFVRHVEDDTQGPKLPEGWFNPINNKDELPMTSIWPDGPHSNAIKIKIPKFNSSDTESLTEAEIQGRRRMMEVMDYHRRCENKSWILDHCSPIIGIREGTRILGDYILKVNDLREGKTFSDGVARGTFYLDGHKPDDDKRTYILAKDELKVPPYQIPLRSLIARDAKNLMMAGRNFSADQLALSSARVATSASMMGQAAGISSAMAVEEGVALRELDPYDIKKVIINRGANLNV